MICRISQLFSRLAVQDIFFSHKQVMRCSVQSFHPCMQNKCTTGPQDWQDWKKHCEGLHWDWGHMYKARKNPFSRKPLQEATIGTWKLFPGPHRYMAKQNLISRFPSHYSPAYAYFHESFLLLQHPAWSPYVGTQGMRLSLHGPACLKICTFSVLMLIRSKAVFLCKPLSNESKYTPEI